ncbi:MAG: phage integrase N-terminal SAM-like domain-containing protein, partial [Lachnospiraceae bacterium]|nr:phage integrase N-terminal SAM-like domain-containing protein [Lachnospiraceae bacterium]
MNYLEQIDEILSFGNRSHNTIKAYKTYTAPFFEYCVHSLGKDPAEAAPSDIRTFLLQLADERNLSDASINHAISELRFFYEAVLGREWNARQIPHRRFKRILPYVPSRGEVQVFISSIEDLKKKAMICLLYSAGLRISEACRLKCSDIQHSKGRIHVAP